MINDNFHLNNKGVSNALQTRNLSRHRWYFYKEGFSPSLVVKAIEESNLKTDDLILDPFNGSGTVTLTSSINGYRSIGFEVNPFTSFLSTTKSINLKNETFQNLANKTIDICQKGEKSYLNTFSTFTKNAQKGKNKWLFNTDVLESFIAGHNSLNNVANSRSESLVSLALLSAVMKNSNAKKDGKCLRYKNNWQEMNLNRNSFISDFRDNIEMISLDLNDKIKQKPIIKTGDSRKLLLGLKDNFKLCITSPPYLNTFDYTDIYRPELFLGGFVKSSRELRELRFKTVRSHIQVKWNDPIENDFGAIFNEVYSKISARKELLMHDRIPDMILAYFEDMKMILRMLRNKADKSASLWFVVSTSAYANEHIPVDLILADIATKVGWNLKEIGVLREIYKRKTRFSPDIDKLRESVVILTT